MLFTFSVRVLEYPSHCFQLEHIFQTIFLYILPTANALGFSPAANLIWLTLQVNGPCILPGETLYILHRLQGWAPRQLIPLSQKPVTVSCWRNYPHSQTRAAEAIKWQSTNVWESDMLSVSLEDFTCCGAQPTNRIASIHVTRYSQDCFHFWCDVDIFRKLL